jgi:hypothetical protein
MSERCARHPRYSEDNCRDCREILDRKRALASNAELLEPCPKHPLYPRVGCRKCNIETNRAYAQEQAAKIAAGENSEGFEQWIARVSAGSDDEVEQYVEQPRRRFFQPLPEGSLPLWPKSLGGMTPRNIAMLLCMPEFIYTNYEQNKTNPSVWILVTAEESFHRPEIKLAGATTHAQQAQGHSEEWSVSPVDDSIKQRAEPIVIHVVDKSSSKTRRKIPPPAELSQALKDAEGIELERLTAKWNKDHGTLTKKELASARTRQYRKIARLKKEVAVYDRPQILEPTREWDIVIPPCPEGCGEIFRREAIRAYVEEAFKTHDHTSWDEWRFTSLENKVIERMYELNFFRGWPNERAKSQWMIAGRPPFGDADFQDYFGWFKPRDKRDVVQPDTTARDNAINGYRRSEGGYVADDSIRRVGPGTVGGWHGAGHGADSDERRGDDYRRQSDREKQKFGK